MAIITPTKPSAQRSYEGDYKPNIIIVGQSGSGKSSSLRNLPKDDPSIHLIELEHKGLPFKGSFCKTKYPSTHDEAIADLKESHADPECKIIVFESLTKYCELSMLSSRAKFSGYEIFNVHTNNIVRLLSLCKSKDKIVVVTAIDDFLQVMSPTGGNSTIRRASVSEGKVWEGKVEKEFLLVFFTEVTKLDEYRFLTNSNGIAPAKTPAGMFKDKLIDNDLVKILKTLEEYYK